MILGNRHGPAAQDDRGEPEGDQDAGHRDTEGEVIAPEDRLGVGHAAGEQRIGPKPRPRARSSTPKKNAAYIPITMNPRTTLVTIRLRIRSMRSGKIGFERRVSSARKAPSCASAATPGSMTAHVFQAWVPAS